MLFIFGEQGFHGDTEGFCNMVDFLVCGTTQLSFQLGIAGGIDVQAVCLQSGNKIPLLDVLFHTQQIDLFADHVAAAVILLSCLHYITENFFFGIVAFRNVDIIPYQNYDNSVLEFWRWDMESYKEMYLLLFRAVEQARRILTEEEFTRSNGHKAVQILAAAQMECERIYIECGDD